MKDTFCGIFMCHSVDDDSMDGWPRLHFMSGFAPQFVPHLHKTE